MSNIRFACLLSTPDAHATLIRIAREFSPVVEEAPRGEVFLDISGTKDEKALLENILKRIQNALTPTPSQREKGLQIISRTHLRVISKIPSTLKGEGWGEGKGFRLAFASSRIAARIAAKASPEPLIIPDGREAEFLAPLSVGYLEPSMDLARIFERWGLSTIGAFAALPKKEVATRLGGQGEKIHLAARGLDENPMIPDPEPPVFAEKIIFDWEVSQLESFLNLAREPLERLSLKLASGGTSARKLEFKLNFEDGDAQAINVEPASPTADVKTWLVLLGLAMQKAPPGKGIAGFSVQAQPETARLAQLSLFGPRAQSPDLLNTTLARLAAMLGISRVGVPSLVDAHAPERFSIGPYPGRGRGEGASIGTFSRREKDISRTNPKVSSSIRTGGSVGVRVLRPRVELEVVTGEKGNPLEVRSLGGGAPAARRIKISGSVRAVSGPWALEERWWSRVFEQRRYWDIELSDGGVYRIYSLKGDRWFADGIYD